MSVDIALSKIEVTTFIGVLRLEFKLQLVYS